MVRREARIVVFILIAGVVAAGAWSVGFWKSEWEMLR